MRNSVLILSLSKDEVRAVYPPASWFDKLTMRNFFRAAPFSPPILSPPKDEVHAVYPPASWFDGLTMRIISLRSDPTIADSSTIRPADRNRQQSAIPSLLASNPSTAALPQWRL
jgi:hypothetical protein